MPSTNYTKEIVSDYCVIDTETTGLSAYYDEIIEIAVLRVRKDQIVESYAQLIKPKHEIDDFITSLTGITNEMVSGMPSILEVKEKVLSFIGEDIILGHCTSFDVRFLQKSFGEELSNKYMDTLQFSRKVYPELEHHRLSDMTEYLGLSSNEHRALADCISTKELYDAIKKNMLDRGIGIDVLWKKSHSGSKSINNKKSIDIKWITPESVDIDEDNFFFGKHVVFTGKLERILRKDAMQIIVNLGGVLDNSVAKTTNYLVLGNNDYNAILKGEKSSKHKKAEKLKLEGHDIEIIDELTFYDLLNE